VAKALKLAISAVVGAAVIGWGARIVVASPDREPPPPTFAYVTNQGSETVSVIDLATFKVATEIKVPGHPAGIAVSPRGDRVYVTAPDAHDIAVIDTATNTVTKRISVGGGPLGIAVHPFNNLLYVADWYSTNLMVIDPATDAIVARIEVGKSPSGVAVYANDKGTRILTADRDSNTVSVIDGTTNKKVGEIAVGSRPFGVTFAFGDGNIAYTANVGSDDVSVIDLNKMATIATVPVGRRPYAVAVTNARVFVTDQYSGTVTAFYFGTHQPPDQQGYQARSVSDAATIEACDHPEGIEYDWQSNQLYVACWFDNVLIRIDATTFAVTGRVTVGDGPRAFGKFLK
jgi:YVTN family beta-propeller protein